MFYQHQFFASALASQNEELLSSVPPSWLFYRPYTHVIRPYGRFSFTSIIKLIALSFAVLKHEVDKRGFIFEGSLWPVINLVTLIHGYLFLILLEIVIGYLKLRSFQQTQVDLSVLQEKPYITSPSRNSSYGISNVKLQN